MPMQNMDISKDKDYLWNSRPHRPPGFETDPDSYGEARKDDMDPTKAPKTWVEGIIAKGYLTPVIKQVADDGSKMWFTQDGVDYIADLNPIGVTHIQKATFGQGPAYKTPQGPSISYNPTSNSNQRDVEEDEDVN